MKIFRICFHGVVKKNISRCFGRQVLDPPEIIAERGLVSSVEKDSDSSISFESSKPCEGFRKSEDLGRTRLYGRSVTKWRCSEPDDPEDAGVAGSVMTFWYDKKLKIPIRMEDDKRKSYSELVNIRLGKPSGGLFKVPADYKAYSFNIPSRGRQ